MSRSLILTLLLAGLAPSVSGGQVPARDPRIDSLVRGVSEQRLERDLRALVGFGTRHTLSDTLSPTRGIGAARRWVKSRFDSIARACGGCLEVRFQSALIPGGENQRVPRDVNLVNVVATLRGRSHPGRYLLMTAHLDSRASDANDAVSDAPGAADDGSGVVAVIEAARLMAAAGPPDKTVVFAALSGEEQGLLGGYQLAGLAADSGWTVEAVLNNDIIGQRAGETGAPNDSQVRVFSEPVPADEPEAARWSRRFTGGEVDGPSRQLARYVARLTDRYVPGFDAVMIYRLDRFGRGGDHRAFNDRGFPAVRFSVMHEDYRRQHQDVRVENGVAYGDVMEAVSIPYIARVTRANLAALASLAWAPPPPDSVRIRGAVSPTTTVRWSRVPSPGLAGYRVYWRETTAPQWTHARWAGDVEELVLEGIVIDNYLFGVAAVSKEGNESAVRFPGF